MATTADYLTQLQADKQTLVDNLVAKGVEASNDETFTTLAPKVADIPTSEPTEEEWDTSVDFVDIDGELLYHYTQNQIQALEELPLPPEHELLLFDKWNWSLEELKEWGKGAVVGAIYKTIDGDTKMVIEIEEPTDVTMYIVKAENGHIDWGDGTIDEVNRTSVGYDYHTYQEAGRYVISIGGENVKIDNANYNIKGFSPERAVKKAYIGTNHSVGMLSYNGWSFVTELVIPENCTWNYQYGLQGTFNNLKSYIFPSTTIARITCQGEQLEWISLPKYCSTIYVSAKKLKRLTPAYVSPNTKEPTSVYVYLNYGYLIKELDCSSFEAKGANQIKECPNLTKYKQHPNSNTPMLENTGISELELTTPYTTNSTYYSLIKNKFKKIVIPNTYSNILPKLDSNFMLEEIVIPETATKLPQYFARYCYQLKSIKGIEYIKELEANGSAFGDTYIDFDISNIEKFGPSTLANSYGLTKAIFNENITEIPNSLCSGCKNLSEAVLPPNLTKIGSSAFSGTIIKEILIPSGITAILDNTFSNTSLLKKVMFASNDNLLQIGNNNFQYVKEITLPNSIQTIGNTFYGYNLKNINIPRDCTSIGTYFCNKSTVLEVDATKCNQVPTLGSNAFTEAIKSTGSLTIKVPSNLYEEWISATNWSSFANYIEAVEVE